jgi:hypothetical protein
MIAMRLEGVMRLKGLLAAVVVVFACSAVVPVVAQAAFELEPGSFKVRTSTDQAGAHADLTTSFAFGQNAAGGVGALLRNAEVVLPVGFAGYPVNAKTCAPVLLQLEQCPSYAQIGTIEIVLRVLPGLDAKAFFPLYNINPSPDQTAVYGFVVAHTVSGEVVVTLGPEYKVRAKAVNVISGIEIVRQSVTIWGVPGAASHDPERGEHCEEDAPGPFPEGPEGSCQGGNVQASEAPVPYLVNPTQCTNEPLVAQARGIESWEGEKAPPVTTDVGPFTGCEKLSFPPTLAVAPELTAPTTPSGYSVKLDVPQSEGAEGLATADLKDAVVTLPSGVVLSPSAATGLVSCSEAQVGLGLETPVQCPPASKLGVVSVKTPAFNEELDGELYLGGPSSGVIREPPFTLYLTFEGHGVLVKIKGTATPNPVTGQITTVFDENPELPFSELKLELNGGSRATVANPSACGAYAAEMDLTPWTAPFEHELLASSIPYEIVGCQAPRFDPAFAASMLSNQAGGYSTMRVTFSREDADQDLGGLSVTMPPGALGNISKVTTCKEPQAAEGTCGPESQIGELTAGAGPGPEPTFIKGGRIFLTGPYQGAPFGLSIDVSEKAGPLDLGTGACDCEVVRASINVNPLTAQITVTNQSLPTGKDGIPFQVKAVNVDINRPEFTFNPTSCEPSSVTGTLTSTQDMSANVSNRFQVTNCSALGFKPGFKVSTSGKTSRADGASLTAKLTYPNVGGHSVLTSGQANIAKVKVDLPKQLPSRLTTLQKACTAATFNANPADCPADSKVGYAKASTPILPVPLEGPAYFVSHGGEEFPSLIIVLQGDGVTADLVGTTFINKAGITSSTFKAVPDVPVGSFELTLPEGKYSALAANGNLCTVKGGLKMPTAFVAQNGAEIHESTKIGVTGCPPTRSKTKGKAKGKKRKHAKKAGKGGGKK